MKRILVLGAGLVSKPLVHYLTDNKEFEVTVASRTVSKAQTLVEDRPNGKALALNVKDEAALEELIKQHDLSVSLLPADEHPKVAKLCLKHKKHMATTSYFSPKMLELNNAAKDAGLTFINECGVDPGMDHMSAMRVIDDAKSKGGKVVSFRSYCGGLPAPEANTNPLGYKFSWAPRGVLVAATNPARNMKNGKIADIPGDELFADPESVEIPGAGKFEGYPNRDSMPYQEMYGLTDVNTMFRGTLRNLNHCEVWYHWVKLGLFNQEARDDLKDQTYAGFMASFGDGVGDPKEAVAKRMGVNSDAPTIKKLEWLGMFEDAPIPINEGGNIDVMAAIMVEKCSFKEGERDMIAMQHEFTIEYPEKTQKVFSSLVDFGIPGSDTSMARTVSLPVAIAARMILEGEITERGVIAPVKPNVYNPILDELEKIGIAFKETIA